MRKNRFTEEQIIVALQQPQAGTSVEGTTSLAGRNLAWRQLRLAAGRRRHRERT
jgi:hypothetical protein